MSKHKEASLFERFIIMIMGLGVALVGAYPLTKQHGGILAYLKKKGVEVDAAQNFLDSAAKRARLKFKDIKEGSETSSTEKTTKSPPKQMDKITKEDKEKLDTLLNDVLNN